MNQNNNKNKNENKNDTVNFPDLNPDNLNFSKIDTSGKQAFAYPIYTEGSNTKLLSLQLPWIKLSSFFGNKSNDKNNLEDVQPNKFNISLDQSIPVIKEYTDVMKKIDERLGSDLIKKKVFEEITRKVVQEVVNRNENLPATEAVKITTMAGCSAVKK